MKKFEITVTLKEGKSSFIIEANSKNEAEQSAEWTFTKAISIVVREVK